MGQCKKQNSFGNTAFNSSDSKLQQSICFSLVVYSFLDPSHMQPSLTIVKLQFCFYKYKTIKVFLQFK